MTSVTLDHATYSYPIYNASGRSLKLAVAQAVVGSRISLHGRHKVVVALDDVSFSLHEGDRVGLVGRNGSGKSTLLRVIAGIAHPQSGAVTVEGRVTPLISRGLGIDPELTARQNVELPLRFLGATEDEIERAMEEIPVFTELGDFFDLPVRTFSDGMRARLSFSICTAVSGNILVLDEWLGAGDAGFIAKARARLDTLVANTGILVLASHQSSLIEQTCNKAIWLDRGRLRAFGDAKSVVKDYRACVAAENAASALS